MRTNWYVRLCLLIAFFSAGPSRAQPRCDETRPAGFGLWMVARETRAYFYSQPANEAGASARLKSFVVLGDLVQASGPDDGRLSKDALVCALYIGPSGSRSHGWVRTRDFVPIQRLREDRERPPDLRDVLARLPPVKSWPSAGKTPYPCYHEDDFVGDFFCVRRADFEKKELCVATTHRPYAPGDCGVFDPGNRSASFETEGWYDVYLFNNGIVIVSEPGGIAWGNHGQSDPDGVYIFSAAADRACRTGKIAPGLPSRKR